MFKKEKLLFVLVSLIFFAVGGYSLQAKPSLQDGRYFPETGFGVDHNVIWDYFQSRGGVDTFGYPVSNLFSYRGFEVQIFQRHVLQIIGEQARPLNLLDPDVMPINTFGGLTFPEYDQALAASAPAPDAANYGEAVRQHLEANVPDTWQDQPVGFLSYYLSAAPASAGGLRTLLALEVWGFPTSQPKPDPNNQNFIYQRFQRGIMHVDATNQITRGILLGDAFKEGFGPQKTPPANSSAEELLGNRQLLVAVPQEGNWALKSWPAWPDNTLLSDPIFDRFYGGVVSPESFPLYFLNFHPKLSPNGRYLLLPGISRDPLEGGDLGSGMWLVDLIEGKSRQLLPQAQIATWSPESDQITYVSGDTLWTVNISENSSPVALFTHPELFQLYAHWSPDGSSIAVATVSATETIDYEGIPLPKETHWLIPTNGEPPRQITNQPGFPMEHVTSEIEWSHDSPFLLLKLHGLVYNLAGEQVLAASGLVDWVPNKTDLLRNSRYGMEIITLEGDVVATISQTRALEWAFSNDGQRLAYTEQDYSGQTQLKVFELEENKNIDVGTFSRSIFNINMLNSNPDTTGPEASGSVVYQQNGSVWIIPAEPNQSPIELFSPGVLVGVVPMP